MCGGGGGGGSDGSSAFITHRKSTEMRQGRILCSQAVLQPLSRLSPLAQRNNPKNTPNNPRTPLRGNNAVIWNNSQASVSTLLYVSCQLVDLSVCQSSLSICRLSTACKSLSSDYRLATANSGVPTCITSPWSVTHSRLPL